MITALLTFVTTLTLSGLAHAYSPTQAKDLTLDLEHDSGNATWENVSVQTSSIKLNIPGKSATIDRQQNIITYHGADFSIHYELPLVLQDLQKLSLKNLQLLSQEKSLSLSFPEFSWSTSTGDGLISQFFLSSQFSAAETVPSTTTRAMLEKSDWSIKAVRLPTGLSFPVPGKLKPIEMRELQNIKAQMRAQVLTSSAQIPGLIPVPVELKARIVPLAQERGVSVDIQSFQIANIELKQVLLSQLKKWETPQLKVNGSVVTWSKVTTP